MTTAAFPAFIIYDPDKLASNKAGRTVDYETEASEVIDLESTYGLRTAAISSLNHKRVRGFFFDPVTLKLFAVAPDADDSTPGIFQTLVHVWQVNAG